MQAEMLDTVVSSNSQELSNASSAIKLFENPLFKARVIMRCSDPWFVAKDVATCIEHSDTSAMCKLCRDKDVAIVNGKEYSADLAEYSKGFSDDSSENPKKGGNPNITVISESGLYRILAKCNLPKCEPFESWVFDEVIGHVNSPLNQRRIIKQNSSHRGRLLLTPCNAKRAEPCAQQAVRFVASRTAFFLFFSPNLLYKHRQHAGDTKT